MVQSSRVLAGELVSEGFLGAALMTKLLDPASPKEVVRDVLMTLSNLSRMNKVLSVSLSVKYSTFFVFVLGCFNP